MIIAAFVAIVSALVTGMLGSWIAGQKYRSPSEGFWLGAVFSFFGCLVEALLPNGHPPSQEEIEAQRQQLADEWDRRQAILDQKKRRADQQYDAIAAAPGRLWEGIGTTGQAIMVGMGIALPFVAILVWLMNR